MTLYEQRPGPERLLMKAELASFSQVSARTVDFWVQTRRIPYFKISRTVRLRLADVLRGVNDSCRVN